MITVEKCVEDIKSFYIKYGRIPKAADFRNQTEFVSYSSIQKHLGSWNNALLTAGLTPISFRTFYTNEELLQIARDFYSLNNELPLPEYFNNSKGKYPSPRVISDRFKSWREYLLAANLDKELVRLTFTNNVNSKEEAIGKLQYYYFKYDRNPIVKELSNTRFDLPSYGYLYNHFGSFNNALIASGLEPNPVSSLGIVTKALDGKDYLSRGEAYLVDYYLYNKFEFVYEVAYPEPYKKWKYDFYLPKLDLYIEVHAGLRPIRLQEKIELNKSLGRNFKVLLHKDIYSNNLQEFK